MKHLFILIPLAFFSFKKEDNLSLDSRGAKIETSRFESCSDSIMEKPSAFIRTVLYEGTLNGTVEISLYLKEQEHPCGGDLTILNAMYKYASQEKWLLLSVTTDKQKERYCMVEDDFTGVLFLEEKSRFFNGSWISPDTKKQFEVVLEKKELKETTIEKLDEILFDDLLFNKSGC